MRWEEARKSEVGRKVGITITGRFGDDSFVVLEPHFHRLNELLKEELQPPFGPLIDSISFCPSVDSPTTNWNVIRNHPTRWNGGRTVGIYLLMGVSDWLGVPADRLRQNIVSVNRDGLEKILNKLKKDKELVDEERIRAGFESAFKKFLSEDPESPEILARRKFLIDQDTSLEAEREAFRKGRRRPFIHWKPGKKEQ